MLIVVIVVCEVLFWAVLLAGLVARYPLRRPRLGGALLVCAPLVDLVLLTASVLDLRAGGTAAPPHALAAVYLGVSVGFGHSMVRWADTRFAHRYAGGPPPLPKPCNGRAHAAHERAGWRRHAAAWAVGCSLMGTAVLVVGASRTETLLQVMALWTVVVVVDALVSFSYTLSPRKA